ncbi:unnamed protein product [Parascedosporium putredinis]|uniref:Probable beta-glucosidase btgE n=1 Tax=Parascedosporium putredinis TaxID=1442378 RepID=A0A9P1MAH0_9PEZI|nr:unnamed protein product [Parascedosporium putredinis]CAI7997649.1 unnamed protein product [Parascedosporium putredinis]
MKATVAILAATAGVASAHHGNHRRAHDLFARKAAGETCVPGCTTVWETFYGEPTFIEHGPEPTPAIPTITVEVLPTPEVEVCPTPGTYSWDATTITVTETTTVCGATTTKVGPGTHTYGGVTTVVDTETTVVCPIAKETESNGVVTSIIEETTYVCPTPGTYTIGPSTSVVTVDETVIVYPTPTVIAPGTYTRPAATVTVTVNNYVTVCPWVGGPAPTPEPQSPAAPAPAPVAPAPAPSPQKPSNTYTPGTGLGGNGEDHWAITYTPYTEDSGECKSRDAVFADIRNIKSLGFNTVRIYSTDCNTLENVGDACEAEGLKIIVGVFVKERGCGYSGVHKEQVEGLVKWGKWHLVSLCVIGNEAIFGGLCNANQLKGLIDSSKAVIKGAGYTGPFSTAETVNVWQQHGDVLCDSIDIGGANTHPYFNADTRPSAAGAFVRGQLDIVTKICGKRAISLECGWPTEGNCNGVACPGVAQQAQAVNSIRSSCGEDVVFFTYGKAFWKGPSSCNCEPYFNIEGSF